MQEGFYPRDVIVSAVYATATWLGGWLSGCLSYARRYCIKTAKPILKLFRPSGSHIILVSSVPFADTQIQGEPFSGDINTQRVGKIGDFRAIFDGNSRLSWKRCEIGGWLLWNVKRKSWVHARSNIIHGSPRRQRCPELFLPHEGSAAH